MINNQQAIRINGELVDHETFHLVRTSNVMNTKVYLREIADMDSPFQILYPVFDGADNFIFNRNDAISVHESEIKIATDFLSKEDVEDLWEEIGGHVKASLSPNRKAHRLKWAFCIYAS